MSQLQDFIDNRYNDTNKESTLSIGIDKFYTSKIIMANELDEKNRRRVTIYLDNRNTKNSCIIPYTIWFGKEYQSNQAGDKFIFIDDKANISIYLPSPEDDQYGVVDISTARKAKQGEAEWLKLFKVLANTTKDMSVPSFDIDAIVDGDISILQQIITKFSNVKVIAVAAVRDYTYQTCTGEFYRSYQFPDLIQVNKDDNERLKEKARKVIEDREKFIQKINRAVEKNINPKFIFDSELLYPFEKYERKVADQTPDVIDSNSLPF